MSWRSPMTRGAPHCAETTLQAFLKPCPKNEKSPPTPQEQPSRSPSLDSCHGGFYFNHRFNIVLAASSECPSAGSPATGRGRPALQLGNADYPSGKGRSGLLLRIPNKRCEPAQRGASCCMLTCISHGSPVPRSRPPRRLTGPSSRFQGSKGGRVPLLW